jgi:hypothetical protein
MRAACVLLLLATGCVIEDRTFEPTGRDADTEDPPWTGVASGTDVNLNAIAGTGTGNLFAVGDEGTVLQYVGDSWMPFFMPTTSSLRAMAFTPGGTLYVVGDGGLILQYTGGPWNPHNSGTGADLFAVWAGAEDDVFAAGQNGIILHYDNDGSGNWDMMTSGSIEDLHALWGFPGSGDAYAGGDEDSLLRWNGVDWTLSTAGGTSNRAGWAGSTAIGVYVSTGGLIRTYMNGDLLDYMSWANDSSSDLLAVWGNPNDPSDMFAVGDGGVARHFSGTYWDDIDLPTPLTAHGIWGDGAGVVFVVGNGGDIYRYTPPP